MIIAQDRSETALERLDAALAGPVIQARDWMQAGRLKLQAGNLTGAMLDFVDATRANPSDPQPRHALGEAIHRYLHPATAIPPATPP